MSTPTQARRPWRATFRTFVAQATGWIVTAGLLLPLVLNIVDEELGDLIPPAAMGWLVLVVGVAVAIANAVTRILAIPAVDAWLGDHTATRVLAADPPPKTPGPEYEYPEFPGDEQEG